MTRDRCVTGRRPRAAGCRRSSHAPGRLAVRAVRAADVERPTRSSVTDLTNVRWLTGFSGSNGWVVIRPTTWLVLVTDGRYAERARAEIAAAGVDAEIVVGRTRPEHPTTWSCDGRLRPRRRWRRGRPTSSHAAWTDLATDIALEPDAGDRSNDCGGSRTTARWRGSARGRRDRRRARSPRSRRCSPTDADRGRRPQRARVPDAPARRRRPSYETIVASGPEHAARPHHQTGRRTIVEGDTVIIDVGALVDGYHSDMTRTFVIGEPTDAAARALRAGARRRSWPGSTPSRAGARRARASTRRAATCSTRPATATGTSTAPVTASGSRSTRTRSLRRCPPTEWSPATW